LDTQIIKVDVEDLSEPEVDHLVRTASSFLEEMKSANQASTSKHPLRLLLHQSLKG
jgi:hypothetical protein